MAGPNVPGTAVGVLSWGFSTAELGLGLKATVPLQRPPHNFLVNMKLEAVDRRNPALIRVASVEDVEDHRIKVARGTDKPVGQEFHRLVRGQGYGMSQT